MLTEPLTDQHDQADAVEAAHPLRQRAFRVTQEERVTQHDLVVIADGQAARIPIEDPAFTRSAAAGGQPVHEHQAAVPVYVDMLRLVERGAPEADRRIREQEEPGA
jgi:hypothetical protein